MKKIILIGSIVFIGLIAALLIGPSFIDWNGQKVRIETTASQALGKPVQITGDIDLALLPSPRLKAQGLKLGDPDALDAGPALVAELLEVRVAILPLLSGTIKATRIVVRGANVTLLTGQDNPPQPPAEAATDTGTSAVPDMALPLVQIQNATIALIDAKTGTTTTVSQINLELSAESMSGPFEASGDLRVEDIPFSLNAAIGNIETPDFPFDLTLSAAAQTRVKLRGKASDVFSASPRATGQLDIEAPDAGAALAAFSGKPKTPDGSALAGQRLGLSTPIRFADQAINADTIDIALGQTQAKASFSADLSGDTLRTVVKLTSQRIDASAFSNAGQSNDTAAFAPIEVNLPNTVEAVFETSISEVTGLPVSLERIEAQLKLSKGRLSISRFNMLLPGGVNAEVSGSFSAPDGTLKGNTNVMLRGANAQQVIAAALGADAAQPAGPIPLELTADAALDGDGARLTALVGKLGDSQINASGKARYGAPVNAEMTARIDAIMLDDWLSDTPKGAQDSQQSGATFAGRLRFDLGVDRLRWDGQLYKSIAAKGVLSGDRVTIESAAIGNAGNARVRISGNVIALGTAQPGLNLKFSADAKTPGRLMAMAGLDAIDTLENAGKLSIGGSVTGTTAAPTVSAQGTLGQLRMDTAAQATGVGSDALASNGTLKLQHPNLAALLSQLKLLEKAQIGKAAQPFTLSAAFNAGAEQIELTATTKNAAGSAELRYRDKRGQYEVALQAAAKSVAQYLQSQGIAIDLSTANLGQLNAAIALAGPAASLNFTTLQLNLGPARISGAGGINVAGKVPVVDVNLKGRNLDLADILPTAQTGARQAYNGTGGRWSKEKLNLEPLAAVDGSVTLEFDRLTYDAYALKDGQISLASSGKTLRMGLDRGALFNGPARVVAALDGSGVPSLALKVDVTEGDIAEATMASAAIAPMTGQFNINAALSGSGASQYDLVKSLSGNASVTAQNGVIDGVDIEAINQRLGNLSSVNDFLKVIGSALRGGQTNYRIIAFDTVANNGVLTTQNGQIDIDGGAQATLLSTINLPRWQINAKGGFSLRDHPDAPPVGVTITGPLDHANVAYDTKSLKQYIAIRVGSAVLNSARSGQGINLKSLLGGGQTQPGTTPSASKEEPEQSEEKDPKEQVRDLIFQGLFGNKNK
ncbi:MAG: AsmA family protein [Pseudomonadota bacterium]